MTILQAIVYGIVQGIAEFLPISSTAHLILLPWFLGWPPQSTFFDVSLHLGTAAAVIIFFFKDWVSLILSGFTDIKSKQAKLFWLLVVATIPGALFGLLLDKYTETFKSPVLIGIMLIIMGIILYYADKLGRRKIELEDMSLKNSIIIGFAQVLAIIPGVSRSGITMSVGRFLGIERDSIAKFTFLMSTPIILGDALYHLMKVLKTGSETISIAPFAVAILTSAVVGLLSIKFLLSYLKKRGFKIFAIYRFVLGAGVIAASFFIK